MNHKAELKSNKNCILMVAAPFTSSVPTNGGNSLQPMETQENNNVKYVIGISAAVVVLIAVVVTIYCFLRRRCCDEGNEANNHSGK